MTAAQMAEVDRITIEELHIGVDILMESASRQIATAARAFLGGSVKGKCVVGLIGSGNNGGDALGALRHLVTWGATVLAELGAPQDRLRGTTNQQQMRLLLATNDRRLAIVHDATRNGSAISRLTSSSMVSSDIARAVRPGTRWQSSSTPRTSPAFRSSRSTFRRASTRTPAHRRAS
ncbi:MAG TPA: NAD(P)H-hydrate epimerase [Candidatus Limnocylindria bacterium]